MPSPDRLSQLLQFLSEEPNDDFINYALGIEYALVGQNEKAAQYFDKTIDINPNYIAAYSQSGKLFETLDIDKAKEFYQKGIVVAERLNKSHELKELKAALAMLNDIED